MSADGTEAVVFDAYGTLLDVGAIHAACASLVEDPATFSSLWRRTQLESTWLRSLMGRYVDFWQITEAALDHVAAATRTRLGEDERRRLMDAWLEIDPYPEAAEAIGRLEAVGPLAVLSNGSPSMLEAALTSAGLRARFAHVLSVDEVGIYKPAPAAYGLAERHLGAPRDRLLFVSGNGWDAAGAKAFGMRVALVDRTGIPSHRLGMDLDLVVGDLGDLADRLSAPAG